ncbi:glutamate-1-semialdehyde 2,1-aminomutase [Desulforegula conservatrix]|uniref:glutamate-1-semialdehyde 2,1-aminomutase n=1 Tax=Desulforegula conservatrix TaxID=153026 RepID=UPI00041AAF59|nr:glutamate-1-semialdehyde 2,1-aminomutase [Desulforegula conservatrix]
MKTDVSRILFDKARNLIPGGVNSPVRACRSVGADPLFISKASGSRIFDADGNSYIDYVGSWGPMILGHNHPEVVDAIRNALENGTSFGAPCEFEVELASLVSEIVPSLEMVRMVNSGTEATMSAIRLARAYTGRERVIKFDGCYHGHADSFLVEAGSGVATLNISGTPGVPKCLSELTMSVSYNDSESIQKLMETVGKEVACIIVEPVAGNMGLVKPLPGFLEFLRKITEEYGALLIFDEVMTGFRVALGGAQQRYNIKPDLSCFGKIIGGGLPVGAYGGRRDIMGMIAPVGSVYQAGTLSGNPLAMAAGVATLKQIKSPGFYEKLEKTTSSLVDGLKAVAKDAGIPVFADYVGSMFGMFFTEGPVNSFADAKKSDTDLFSRFYREMRDSGIYLAPSQFEAGFVSSAHTEEDIKLTVETAKKVLARII